MECFLHTLYNDVQKVVSAGRNGGLMLKRLCFHANYGRVEGSLYIATVVRHSSSIRFNVDRYQDVSI
jgi:hypothetical protein